MSSTKDIKFQMSPSYSEGCTLNSLGRSIQHICRITKARLFMCRVTAFITLRFSNCILVFSHLNFIPTLFYLIFLMKLILTDLRNCSVCLIRRLCNPKVAQYTRVSFHIKTEASHSCCLPFGPYLFYSDLY